MKKNIARGSVLTVAALSLLIGGTSHQISVKEQVSNASVVVGKTIENSITKRAEFEKGNAVKEVAQATENKVEPVSEPVSEDVQPEEIKVEEKAAKVESNQIVANIDGYLNIRAEASEEAEVVGKFYNGNVGTIVEKGDQWSLVASGNAYGYVSNDYLLFGSDAEDYIENNCDQVAKVTAETLNVRAEESTDSDVLSCYDEGDAITILGKDGDWVKVATSEESVGYVARDYVYIDYVYETAVTVEEEQAAIEAEREAEEEAQRQAEEEAQEAAQETAEQEQANDNSNSNNEQAQTAEEKKEPETVTSTDVSVSDEDSATETVQQESGSGTGQEIADFAVQFVGNPYVYGGTSLTKGADCSGFVQSVYANFNISLPRVAADQAGAGRKVSVDNLQPGDLLFYHGFGHVAIYIGGGQVVHASNAATGIKISSYNYSPIDKAVRIVD